MANAFQRGAMAQAGIDTANLANRAETNRQKGVNALAQEFGDQALAPSEMATVRGTERADKTFIAREDQRGINNERTARQDEISEEERQQKKVISGLGQIVGGMKAGIKSGVPVEDVVSRFTPVLKNAFNVTDEELLALPQQIAANPELLDQLEGALRVNSGKRAVGQPRTFKRGDGTMETRQFYTDGTFDVIDGALMSDINAERRIATSETNAATNAEKIKPGAASVLASGKQAGKNLATAVTEGLPEAQNLAVTVQNGQRALELVEGGIRSGSLVNVRQEASRFFADIIGIEQEQIAETDEFNGLVGAFVAEQIKAFGAGTGLSDADREFAKGIVGGDITMDAEAIKRLVTIQNDINAGKIRNYNKLRDAFIDRNPDFGDAYPRVEVPGDKKRLVFNPETGRLE